MQIASQSDIGLAMIDLPGVRYVLLISEVIETIKKRPKLYAFSPFILLLLRMRESNPRPASDASLYQDGGKPADADCLWKTNATCQVFHPDPLANYGSGGIVS